MTGPKTTTGGKGKGPKPSPALALLELLQEKTGETNPFAWTVKPVAANVLAYPTTAFRTAEIIACFIKGMKSATKPFANATVRDAYKLTDAKDKAALREALAACVAFASYGIYLDRNGKRVRVSFATFDSTSADFMTARTKSLPAPRAGEVLLVGTLHSRAVKTKSDLDAIK